MDRLLAHLRNKPESLELTAAAAERISDTTHYFLHIIASVEQEKHMEQLILHVRFIHYADIG